MELLTFTIAAGETKQFRKAGRYFELIDAPGELNVTFDDASGGRVDDMLGALSGFYAEGEFASFAITNPGAAAQSVKLMLTGGRGGSRRQPGNVRVIDQSADKTLAGNQFLQSASMAATVGQGSLVYLGANGGAGKYVVLKRVSVQSATAGSVLLVYGTSVGTLPAPAQALASKLLGGAASSSARLNAQAIAAATPSGVEITGVAGVVRIYVPANQSTAVPLETPIVLAGARVLCISAEALNRDVSAIFDVEELLA